MLSGSLEKNVNRNTKTKISNTETTNTVETPWNEESVQVATGVEVLKNTNFSST